MARKKYDYTQRTEEEILKAFDDGYPKFKWFIVKHFHVHVIRQIEEARKQKAAYHLVDLLNNVWFHLPDRTFNIINMPAGWAEFLNVIEI